MRRTVCGRLATVLLAPVVACAPTIGTPNPLQMQAWVVYFDGDRGLAELQEHGELFDRVSLFAYELAPDGSPIPAPNMQEMIAPFLRLASEKQFDPWVTVVNDVRHSVDSVIAKDPALVHELIADPARRNAHAQELVTRVVEAGFKGLHLDYEQVPESDSTPYQAFIREVSQELQQRGLGLEIVVEPVSGPLPASGSASVAVMAYDLFGTHSGPGPRSTPEFVMELGSRAAVDSDSAAALAIAVGGFAWEPDGEVNQLDWSHAQQLADSAERTQRDVSGVPTAYLGNNTEIWFEDIESLLGKWRAAWEAGFRRLAIWRLGGNDERLFRLIGDVRPDSD